MDIVSFVFKENLHNGYWFFNEETIQFHEAQERLNELFIDRISITPSSSILDIGC
jgi:cyclopropane fatty-acyl-phospholipid synthase-like methyltransferase